MKSIPGYDQWKTASPYDDFDDTICACCGYDLNGDQCEVGDWSDDGFCCQDCQIDYEDGFSSDVIRPISRMFEDLFGEHWRFDIEQLSRAVYKGTPCGAWVAIEDQYTLKVGSIVEGSDAEVGPEYLKWPFTKDEFWKVCDNVNEEACDIFDECHCSECECELGWNEELICDECWQIVKDKTQ